MIGQTETDKKVALLVTAIAGGGKGTAEEGLRSRGITYATLPFREILDREVLAESDLGRQIQGFRKLGQLVPNDIILPIIEEAFEKVEGTKLLFLDGFPRNVEQSKFALERVRHYGYKRIVVLHIDTPTSTCLRRLKKRARDVVDTDPELVAQRIDEYEEKTVPMIKFLRINAEDLGIEFYMVDGQNLITNMDAYIRMLDIGWMSTPV
ncbi:MAG: adenylate kinase [Patescibacteria group bacterium]|nr:adenylate kinase [Patescibacteria group bacterium]